jgi:hypothetical protein
MKLILFRVVLPPRAAVLLAPLAEPTKESESDWCLHSEEKLGSLLIGLMERGLETSYEARGLEALDESVAELRAHVARAIGDIFLECANEAGIDIVVMASHGWQSSPPQKGEASPNTCFPMPRNPF